MHQREKEKKKKNIEMTKKELNLKSQKYPKKKRWFFLDLAELGLEGGVDLIKGASKSGEFFASLFGNDKLSHPIPVYVLRCFECHIHHFLSSSAHFLGRSVNLRVFRLETQCDCPVLDADSPFVVDPGGGGSSGCAMVVYCVWVGFWPKKLAE